MPNLKSICRFNLRRLVLTIIGFVLSNSVYAQSQAKEKYSENEPRPSKTSSAKIRLDDETQTPHILVGGFYTTRDGFESKLLMNNKGPQPIEVSPTLYGDGGAIMQMPVITVERNSFITVNLRDWANFAGEAFRQGNIRLFHRGKDLVLGCNVLVIDESKSLTFENKLNELGKFDSRRLEGVWWIPSNNTDSTIVLTNTSDELITVAATLTRNPHNSGSAQMFTLLPHQTKVLDVREDFPQGEVFARAKVLGLSLTQDGAEGSLLAWTMIKDESKGYSNIATFTNPAKAKSNQYHGAGLQIGSVGNDELEPVIVLRNTTNAKVDVNIRIPYTNQDGERETVSINTVKLNAREVHQVNMQRAANLRDIKTAGIEIEYAGSPGAVVASAQSVSKSGTQVFRTLLWDAPALKSASSMYPFSIEGTSSTKAYIKNAGFKDEVYVSHITWRTDGEYFIPIKTIKKGETVEIDVKKLRDEQIPDERGRTIPLNISNGQIHWLLRRSDTTEEAALENKVPLVGQALQVDTAKGIHYSYFCISCCEYAATSFATLVPGNAQAQHPGALQYLILEDGSDCYGNAIYSRNITRQGYDWTSTNTSAATIIGEGADEGYTTTTGAGQTQIRVKISLPEYNLHGYECDGGPLLTRMTRRDEQCDESVRPAKIKDGRQVVSFSKIAYKKETKRNIALRPEDCVCLTTSPTETLTADLTVLPQVIITPILVVPKASGRTVRVEVSPAGSQINLTLTTRQGTGQAIFNSSGSNTLTITNTQNVRIEGIMESSQTDNIRIEAKVGQQNQVVSFDDFTVLRVDLNLNNGNVSSDNSALGQYQFALGTTNLGAFYGAGLWRTGAEIVGIVYPNDFPHPIVLRRSGVQVTFLGSVLESTIILQEPDETSDPVYRDDNPQSGGSVGKVYDLDAPGFAPNFDPTRGPVRQEGDIIRKRWQFSQWATVTDGSSTIVVSMNNLQWYARISLIVTASNNFNFHNDVSGDNVAQAGTTNMTWNLQQ
jgi:hypothetical protein